MDLGRTGKCVLDAGGTKSMGRAIVGTFGYERMLARSPSGRMGTPQEVAAAPVFLAGAPASFVSGISFIVDGAMTARVQY